MNAMNGARGSVPAGVASVQSCKGSQRVKGISVKTSERGLVAGACGADMRRHARRIGMKGVRS